MWISWCRRFALVVAACVGLIMIFATLNEGENGVGINMPVYLSQDVLRITVFETTPPVLKPGRCAC